MGLETPPSNITAPNIRVCSLVILKIHQQEFTCPRSQIFVVRIIKTGSSIIRATFGARTKQVKDIALRLSDPCLSGGLDSHMVWRAIFLVALFKASGLNMTVPTNSPASIEATTRQICSFTETPSCISMEVSQNLNIGFSLAGRLLPLFRFETHVDIEQSKAAFNRYKWRSLERKTGETAVTTETTQKKVWVRRLVASRRACFSSRLTMPERKMARSPHSSCRAVQSACSCRSCEQQ